MWKRRPPYWKLVGTIPVPCSDPLEWADWFETSMIARRVAQTQVGQIWVSTVFMGLDHNYTEEGDPILFETIIFTDKIEMEDLTIDRCSTWEQAKAMHKRGITEAEAIWARTQITFSVKKETDIGHGQ